MPWVTCMGPRSDCGRGPYGSICSLSFFHVSFPFSKGCVRTLPLKNRSGPSYSSSIVVAGSQSLLACVARKELFFTTRARRRPPRGMTGLAIELPSWPEVAPRVSRTIEQVDIGGPILYALSRSAWPSPFSYKF